MAAATARPKGATTEAAPEVGVAEGEAAVDEAELGLETGAVEAEGLAEVADEGATDDEGRTEAEFEVVADLSSA
jgi:hypothetical protein